MPLLQVRDYALSVNDDRAPLHGVTAQVFVGRDRELTELSAGLDESLSGRGRFFLLFGEPGIGKTRLADEVATRASQRGARVLWGRCWEGGGAPAYWPWVQIIRSYARSCGREKLMRQLGAGASYIAEMVPELRDAIGETGALSAASFQDAEHARFYLFDAVTQFLKSVSAEQPLVLIFDDLHAADQPSLLLLRFLAREQRESHILTIATYRDAEMRRVPPIAEVLGEIGREAPCLPLGGLREAEVARFIQEATGQSPSKKLASSLYQATEGNPFFVNEIVRLLLAEGRIHGSGPAAWTGFRIPDEVREAVRRRLGPLSTESKSTLTLASVVGRDFRLAELAAITGSPADRLLELLGASLAAGIIVEGSAAADRYRFFHAVIRDTRSMTI